MDDWSAWIGRRERREDRIDRGAATRWAAMLDRDLPPGGTVPQGFHWCLCLPDAPTALLGSDGHPRRDTDAEGLLPPVPLPRRMWAASKVSFLHPLPIDAAVVRTSRLVSIEGKQGSSGALVFATIVHETLADGRLAVRETQSIVYRAAAAADTPPAPPPLAATRFDPAGWSSHRVVLPDAPLLFRYSALTFNSHRIHYDLPYAVEEEGYRGLVVHGPLTATLLLDLARRSFGEDAVTQFDFRGVSPAIAGEPLHLVMREKDGAIELGAFAADGRQVMTASARREAG